MRLSVFVAIGAAALIAGCVHPGPAPRSELMVDAAVTVTKDSSGKYNFSYSAPFADAEGNFDFTDAKAVDRIVTVTFSIADASLEGLKFKPTGSEAIWLIEKEKVGSGSPTGAYQGREFYGFAVSEDGQKLTLSSLNNDKTVYRYALRFDLGGETIVHDPDWGNGGCQTHC